MCVVYWCQCVILATLALLWNLFYGLELCVRAIRTGLDCAGLLMCGVGFSPALRSRRTDGVDPLTMCC